MASASLLKKPLGKSIDSIDVKHEACDDVEQGDISLADMSIAETGVDEPAQDNDKAVVKKIVTHSTSSLLVAWKSSALYSDMLQEIQSDEERFRTEKVTWPPAYRETYAESHWYYFRLLWERQLKLTFRDKTFIAARFMRILIIAVITASLFNGVNVDDVHTLSGFLFYCVLVIGVGNLALVPQLYNQRSVYYKHSNALFYPASMFAVVQTIALIPIQIIETIVFCSITYWSIGLSADMFGGKFLLFTLLITLFTINYSQFVRLFCALLSSQGVASPMSGVLLIVMVLYSGYTLPYNYIPNWLKWLYWISPFSWTIRAVTVNEYTSSDYDFMECVNEDCTRTDRFGDITLRERGNPTDSAWIGYSIVFLVLQFFVFLFLTIAAFIYIRREKPMRRKVADLNTETCPDTDIDYDPEDSQAVGEVEIPFEPMTLAFKKVWYTVALKGGEELDILKGVSGHFEPGSLTALMGSSGKSMCRSDATLKRC